MKISAKLNLGALIGAIAIGTAPAMAQVVPDRTLPNNTTVTPNENRFTIEGGTAVGGSLFHSFQEFSIPTGSEAFFNNAIEIENIITRITGNNISEIDGLIRANGTANLLLINPNGLRFGPNARLNVGGSFLGSSADGIWLSDGTLYSAVNPAAPPLLTMNVPVGLQVGANPGQITVEGNGHGFTATHPNRVPIDRSQRNQGLQVNPGRTLALIGGNIDLNGGVLNAEGGRIELGSVVSGKVKFDPLDVRWQFSYEGIENFSDIRLSEQATADTSGIGSGSIQIFGRQVTVTDGSKILIQTQDSLPGESLSVNAQVLEVSGTTPDRTIQTGLNTETIGSGKSADIFIHANQVRVLNGAQVLSSSFSQGGTGNLTIDSSELIQVKGADPSSSILFSLMGSWSFGAGNSGTVNLSTHYFELTEGGNVTSPSFGTGEAGDITVNASESIRMAEVVPGVTAPILTTLSSPTLGSGDAGEIIINTQRLLVENGASISTSTQGSGNAGNVVVNALESVELRGGVPGFTLSASIDSSATIAPKQLQEALGLSPMPSGESGNVVVNTPQLIVADLGKITVQNQGTRQAGNLELNVGSILLDTQGNITATTASGEGGNINITTDSLQLRRNSQISTEAGGSGNGGNININATTILALENSDINANAFEGSGGNIAITTEGIFGTDFRSEKTPLSDITASSEFGVEGNVSINSPDVDTSGGLLQLPDNFIDPDRQVVSDCSSYNKGSSFAITGPGGIPADPTTLLQTPVVWHKLQLIELATPMATDGIEIPRDPVLETPNSQPTLEATSWLVNRGGHVELIAGVTRPSGWYRLLQCQDLSAQLPLL